jgi:hypothetical protein
MTEPYVHLGNAFVLKKDIAAIQAIGTGGGRPALGMMVRLPQGLEVEVCGIGFSDQTVKVQAKGSFFFVLRRNVAG